MQGRLLETGYLHPRSDYEGLRAGEAGRDCVDRKRSRGAPASGMEEQYRSGGRPWCGQGSPGRSTEPDRSLCVAGSGGESGGRWVLMVRGRIELENRK